MHDGNSNAMDTVGVQPAIFLKLCLSLASALSVSEVGVEQTAQKRTVAFLHIIYLLSHLIL